MNVYCAASIRGDLTHKAFADLIPSFVRDCGCNPLSEIILKAGILSDSEIFERDIKWLEESSCLIAEVSSGSTGVGFEIAYALYHLGIPVLALHNNGSSPVSAMITGCSSALLRVEQYSGEADLMKKISVFLEYIRNSSGREGIR